MGFGAAPQEALCKVEIVVLFLLVSTGPSGIIVRPHPSPPSPIPPLEGPGIRASCLPLFLSHIHCRTGFTDELGSGRGQVLTDVAVFFGTLGAGKCWLSGEVGDLAGASQPRAVYGP